MDARIFLEFNERTSGERPIDQAGSLTDLDKPAGGTMPSVIDGSTGRARLFDPNNVDQVLTATDLVPGSTLLTRDVTVQAILSWDIVAQGAWLEPGTIIARGKGNAAAEYLCFGLELRAVNVAARAGELRWIWQDIAGTLKTQIGGHFQASTDVVMLTATRRWVSAGEVVLRYYLGDELLADVTSVDGSIGGGTTGMTTIGKRLNGGSWERGLTGAIEQLRVLPRELCQEEIRATWKRMTVHQPRTRQLVRALHPQGMPVSESPGSSIQRENALWGDSLGYAVGQAENVRDNIYPQRAYGKALEEWELAMRRSPGPRDSIDTRRARVVGRLAQRRGVSLDGIGDAMKPYIDTATSNLEVLAFDQTVREDWASGLRAERWYTVAPADGAATIASGQLQLDLDLGGTGDIDYPRDPWLMVLTSIGGFGRGANIIAKVTPGAVNNGQSGVLFADRLNHNYVVLALTDGGPSLQAEVWRNGLKTATPVNVALGTGGAPVWLHLYQAGPTIAGVDPGTADGDFIVGRSTAGPLGPFTYSAAFQAPLKMDWAGLVNKRIGNIAADNIAAFDDVIVRMPNATRAFHLYVYRNPALPGRPDLIGANSSLREIKHAWTHAYVITKKSFIAGDPACVAGGGPLGGF